MVQHWFYLADKIIYKINTCQKWNENKVNFSHLNLLISTENWYFCLDIDNVDNVVEVFNCKITGFIYHSIISLNKYKPKKIIKLKEWNSIGIKTSIRNREKLLAKLKSIPFDICFKNLYNMY